ncbi:hypothetical protein GW17_00061334, partial [Ensete ventricosum]
GGACGHGRLWPAHRGGNRPRAHPLATQHPQRGPTTGRSQGAAASRDNGVGRRGGRPLAGWLSAGKGSCRLLRGSSGSGSGTNGARGVRASF